MFRLGSFNFKVVFVPPVVPEHPKNGSGICPICFKDCTGDNRFTFHVPEGSRFEDPVEYCGKVSCFKELLHSGFYICTGVGVHEGCKDCSHAEPHYFDKKHCNPLNCTRGTTKLLVKCVPMNQAMPPSKAVQERLRQLLQAWDIC